MQEIIGAVEAARDILVITHIEPDGDALGSLTAVGLALSQRNKRATLVCDNGSLNRFSFLAMSKQILMAPPDNERYDLIIALDCGDESRMGNAYACLAEPRPRLVNIDHHITNTYFGAINLVDSGATSTCEILYALLPRLGVRWTADLATSVLTGMVTDTLCFRTVGVRSGTLRAASELMEAGADLATVTMNGINLTALDTLNLYERGLHNMRLDGGLLWTTISNQERRQLGYRGTGNGGLASMLGDVSEALMGAVLTETDDGKVKANFRCRPPYDVAEVAVNLGGGGHPLAAGCTLDGPLAAAESLVVAVAKEAIERQREASNGR